MDLVDNDDDYPPDACVDSVDVVPLDDFRALPVPASNLIIDSPIFSSSWYSGIMGESITVHIKMDNVTATQYKNPDFEVGVGCIIE